MTLWFSLEWGGTHISYNVMFIFTSLPTGGADVIYITLDHIYILSLIYHIHHPTYLCILPPGGADVCWEVWPANWQMGDGEGDAQKKATLDTLNHGFTNAFQCHCLCLFVVALKTLNWKCNLFIHNVTRSPNAETLISWKSRFWK